MRIFNRVLKISICSRTKNTDIIT